jgi:hypothetical protein
MAGSNSGVSASNVSDSSEESRITGLEYEQVPDVPDEQKKQRNRGEYITYSGAQLL